MLELNVIRKQFGAETAAAVSKRLDRHRHHVAIKGLGHLLTRSGLTHPQVSSVVFLGSFCLSGCSFYQSG
jgi:hypothetical protein